MQKLAWTINAGTVAVGHVRGSIRFARFTFIVMSCTVSVTRFQRLHFGV